MTAHLTLALQAKSPADFAAMQAKLPGLVPALYKAGDAMGTMHYCRFIAFGADTVYLLADVDGEVETALEALPKYFGAVLEPLLAHVKDAPPMPLASSAATFSKWANQHHLKAAVGYENYRGVSVSRVKSLAANAGITFDVATAQQLPLLVMMPMKGRLATVTLQAGLKVLRGLLYKGADGVGTAHFAHLVEMPNNYVAFFTVYDGPYDKYAQDFAEQMGPAFDLIFAFVSDPPATPTSKNVAPFTQWVMEHNLKPLAFYSAYPGLQVADIKALLADG